MPLFAESAFAIPAAPRAAGPQPGDTLLRRLVDDGPAGIVISTNTGAILDANDAFLAIVGYTREDLERGGIDWRRLTPAEWLASDERAIAELGRTGRFEQYEKEFVRADGARVPVSLGGVRISETDDTQVCYVVDLSGVVGSEVRTRFSELHFEQLADALPQIVMIARPDRSIVYANRGYETLTGIPVAQLGERWQEAIHPDDVAAVERVRATGEPYEIEYRLRRASDGIYRWHFARVSRMADGYWLASAMDIDDRKRAEERLEIMYQREHRVASVLQEAALPRALPRVPGFELDAHYRAGRDEATIGGDWFDAIVVDGHLIVSVGDVAGNGLEAAVLMGNLRQLLRGAAHVTTDPVAMLDIADRTLRSERDGGMVTAFIGVIDPAARTMRYASAGHVPALLRSADGEVVELDDPGLPLGCRDFAPGGTGSTIVLPSNSCLLLYTDGLVELSRDIVAGERLLRERLSDMRNPGAHPAKALVDRMIDGARALDDIAVLRIHVS